MTPEYGDVILKTLSFRVMARGQIIEWTFSGTRCWSEIRDAWEYGPEESAGVTPVAPGLINLYATGTLTRLQDGGQSEIRSRGHGFNLDQPRARGFVGRGHLPDKLRHSDLR